MINRLSEIEFMSEMAGIHSTLIKEKNAITNYETTVVTTGDIVHEVNLEGKRTGYVIKIGDKKTPFTAVDIDGSSGNVKTLDEDTKKMCLVYIGKNLLVEKKAELLTTLITMKLKGEI